MYKMIVGAVSAACLFCAVPAASQELPLKSGDFWDVGAITIDDGHIGQYADYLAGAYRKQMEFEKSKGWIKGYYVLSNLNKRQGEPDLYLVTIFDHVTTPAEDVAREKEMNNFLQQSTRDQLAGSGQRASYRHIGSDILLQEMTWAH